MRTSAPAEEIRLRAAGAIMRDRRILLSRFVSDAFWALPGGRVEAGETSRRGLVRELREELGGTPARIGRLMFVVENRFACGRRRFHEVGFVYEVGIGPGAWPGEDREIQSPEADLRLRWIALSDLAGIDLRPHLLRDRLASGPRPGLEHLEVDELPDVGA